MRREIGETMKIIRITQSCALRFLEEAHKPGGRAAHLVEAHENMMFKDGTIKGAKARKARNRNER